MSAVAITAPVIDQVLAVLDLVSEPAQGAEGTSWKARCPAHDDSNPSLAVTEMPDGTVLVHCFAGCAQADLRAALPMIVRANGGDTWMPGGIQHVATYDYVDVDGQPLYQVLRGVKEGRKEFRQRVADPTSKSGWTWSLKSLGALQRNVLYLAPAVVAAIEADETVYVVEGEKDVHAALAHGAAATCNAGGAGKFKIDHAKQLAGADVVIVQDRDEPGRKHAAGVYRLLQPAAASVRIVEAKEGKDLTDHLEAGHGLDDLVDVAPPEMGSVAPPLTPPAAGAVGVPDAADGWTDSAVSERFARSVGGRLLWTKAIGFMEWKVRNWTPVSDQRALELCRHFAKGEVARALDTGDYAQVKAATGLLGKKKLSDVLTLTKGQIEEDYGAFDTDPDIVVVGNGVVDLPTDTLMPHDPTRLVTKSTPVAYRPGMTHADWDAALGAVTPQVADWLQLRLGQGLTGYVPDDDVLPVLKGGGENGKSTLLGAALEAVGDYGEIIPDKVLLGKPDDHSTEKMTLRGLRIAVQEETPEGRRLNIAQIKKILGAPAITARYTHKDNVTFVPVCSVFVSTNYELSVDETDDGTWRRLAEVPFPLRYRKVGEPLETPNDRRGDPGLRARVKKGQAQQETVLAWLISGARMWYQNGRAMPAKPSDVIDATGAWQRRADHWLAFAQDHLIVDPDWAIWVNDSQRAMNEWLSAQSHAKWSMGTFRGRLAANSWLKQPGLRLSGRERRDKNTVSRPKMDSPLGKLPEQGQYIVGVRFRTDLDDAPATPTPTASQCSVTPTSAQSPDRPMPVITDLDDQAVA